MQRCAALRRFHIFVEHLIQLLLAKALVRLVDEQRLEVKFIYIFLSDVLFAFDV